MSRINQFNSIKTEIEVGKYNFELPTQSQIIEFVDDYFLEIFEHKMMKILLDVKSTIAEKTRKLTELLASVDYGFDPAMFNCFLKKRYCKFFAKNGAFTVLLNAQDQQEIQEVFYGWINILTIEEQMVIAKNKVRATLH